LEHQEGKLEDNCISVQTPNYTALYLNAPGIIVSPITYLIRFLCVSQYGSASTTHKGVL